MLNVPETLAPLETCVASLFPNNTIENFWATWGGPFSELKGKLIKLVAP